MKGMYILGYVETKEEKLLKSADAVKKSVLKVCGLIGLKVVGKKYYVFEGSKGITYCFILSQSHFVVHTWPEESKIFFDIFTCNKELNEKKCIEILSREFKGKVKKIRKVGYR